MIYLDNAASGGSKPTEVVHAVLSSLRLCANPGRSGHRLAVALAERVHACRALLFELFDGFGVERTIFTKNCTEALNIALMGVLKEGDHVVASCLEHNAVLRPLEALKRTKKVTVDIALLSDRKLLPETVLSLVNEKTRMVCVTAASNVTGEAPDLLSIRRLLPPHILLLADGAQAAGHFPIRMKETGIDLLALAGHKGLHAIQGAGALLFSDRVSPRPVLFGGTGSESENLDMPLFYPDRLEAGTLSFPAIASLFEGALHALHHAEKDGGKLLKLTEAAHRDLEELPIYSVYSSPNRSGIVAFAHRTRTSEDIAAELNDRFDIAVRGGLHCAPLAHAALGTAENGLVRASFSPFQGMREKNALINALKKLQ